MRLGAILQLPAINGIRPRHGHTRFPLSAASPVESWRPARPIRATAFDCHSRSSQLPPRAPPHRRRTAYRGGGTLLRGASWPRGSRSTSTAANSPQKHVDCAPCVGVPAAGPGLPGFGPASPEYSRSRRLAHLALHPSAPAAVPSARSSGGSLAGHAMIRGPLPRPARTLAGGRHAVHPRISCHQHHIVSRRSRPDNLQPVAATSTQPRPVQHIDSNRAPTSLSPQG